MISVIIADTQPLFRDAVARVIRQDAGLQLAAELADGRAVLAAIRRDVPTVAVIARDLAELDGERVLAAVARERLGTRVLVLTDGPPGTSTWSLLGNGAAGVLSRGVTAEALRSAVHRVATGGTALCEDAQAAVADEIRVRHPREGPLLSQREREVLDLLADGLSTPAIARRLQLGVTTVRTHVARLHDKFGVSNRAELVREGMRRKLLD
jgi:two-component system nitrate/nitrite response regulator NarL